MYTDGCELLVLPAFVTFASLSKNKFWTDKGACCKQHAPFGLLQTLFVSFDHLLDHLAADGAGLTGGQVTVVAVLQVDTNLPWCPFYIVNDSDEEVRQAVDCQEQTL